MSKPMKDEYTAPRAFTLALSEFLTPSVMTLFSNRLLELSILSEDDPEEFQRIYDITLAQSLEASASKVS